MTTQPLSLSELRQAASVGVERMLRAIHAGRSEPYGHPRERGEWEVVIHGCAAEMAVAKFLDRYWGDDPRLDYNGDVGPYHVRSTDRPDGCLILYRRDPDDGYFILVITADMPTFALAGFIVARDGKQEKYLDAGRLRSRGWMVPQQDLRPIQELP